MNISVYNTRTMMAALEQMKAPRRFFLDTFFNFSNPSFSNERTVDIDIWKGKRHLANFQNDKIAGQKIDSINYTTQPYIPGYLKPKKVIDADILDSRPAGGVIYNGAANPARVVAEQAGKNLAELRNAIIRRMEWMAVTACQLGKYTISGEGIASYDIDFNMASDHLISLTSTAKWSDSANCTPIDDLRDWKKKIAKDSGITPDIVVMGEDAFDYFLDSDQVQAYLDKKNLKMGEIVEEDLNDGSTYQGRIAGLKIYTYNEWYLDTDGVTELAMMNTNKVVMGSSQAYCSTHYAQIRDLSARVSTDFHPKSWEENDPSVQYLMLQSAPLVALNQADAFICATVHS